MSKEKVLIYKVPTSGSDDVEEMPVCAIARDGMSLSMSCLDSDTAKMFKERVTRSIAAPEIDDIEEGDEGEQYSTLAKIVGQTYGLLVASTIHNDLTEAQFEDAAKDLKFKVTFKVKNNG